MIFPNLVDSGVANNSVNVIPADGSVQQSSQQANVIYTYPGAQITQFQLG